MIDQAEIDRMVDKHRWFDEWAWALSSTHSSYTDDRVVEYGDQEYTCGELRQWPDKKAKMMVVLRRNSHFDYVRQVSDRVVMFVGGPESFIETSMKEDPYAFNRGLIMYRQQLDRVQVPAIAVAPSPPTPFDHAAYVGNRIANPIAFRSGEMSEHQMKQLMKRQQKKQILAERLDRRFGGRLGVDDWSGND